MSQSVSLRLVKRRLGGLASREIPGFASPPRDGFALNVSFVLPAVSAVPSAGNRGTGPTFDIGTPGVGLRRRSTWRAARPGGAGLAYRVARRARRFSRT